MKVLNTINLEQKEPIQEHTLGREHQQLSYSKSESISDPVKMGLNTWFKKPVVFDYDSAWTTGLPEGSIISNYQILDIITNSPTPGRQALGGVAYFRSGFRFELRLTSSPFHSGKLIFYYVPPSVRLDERGTVYQQSMFPSVYADAGNSSVAVLDVPFIATKDFFATYNPDTLSDLGRIIVAVFNPLGIGTGGPTVVNYTIAMVPTDNDLAIPVLGHDVQLQMDMALMALGTTVAEAGLGEAVGLLFNKIFSKDEHPTSPPDKHPNNSTTPHHQNPSAPSVANITGVTNEHLSLVPENTSYQEMYETAPDNDEMDLKFVASTPGLIGQRNWAGSDAVDTIIFLAPISPMAVGGQSRTNTATTYNPHYLSFAIEPFAFWRGSIDYHFSFAATEMHKGKVLVAWIPNDNISATGASQTVGPTPSVSQLSVYPNEVFDLSLNREFTFRVPYNSETPYKRIGPFYPLNDNPLTQSFRDNTLGTIIMIVYNKLVYPTTTANNINFNIYSKAGPDFEFRGLRNNDEGQAIFPVSYIELEASEEVINEASLHGMKHEHANAVGITEDTISTPPFQSGSDELNLRKLLARYYPQFAYTFTLAANQNRTLEIACLPGPIQRLARATNLSDPVFRNLVAHYKDIYAFWHGSLNYFITHNTTVNTPLLLTVTHAPNSFLQTFEAYPSTDATVNEAQAAFYRGTAAANNAVDLSISSAYSHLSNLRVNPTVEITVPYRSIYRRLYSTYETLDTLIDEKSTGELLCLYSNPSQTEITVSAAVYQSTGDDFRFKYLVPPDSRQVAPLAN